MTDNLVPLMEGTIHLVDAGRAARAEMLFTRTLCKYVRSHHVVAAAACMDRSHCAAEAAFRPPPGQNNAKETPDSACTRPSYKK